VKENTVDKLATLVHLRNQFNSFKSEEDLVSCALNFLRENISGTALVAFVLVNNHKRSSLYGFSQFSTDEVLRHKEELFSRIEERTGSLFHPVSFPVYIEPVTPKISTDLVVDHLVVIPMILENKLEGALLVHSPTEVLPAYELCSLVTTLFQERYFIISHKHQALLYKKMDIINEARNMIYSVVDLEDMFSILGELVLNHAKAQMGFMVLYDEATDEPTVRCSWHQGQLDLTLGVSEFERDFPDNLDQIEIEGVGNLLRWVKGNDDQIIKLDSVKVYKVGDSSVVDVLLPELLVVPMVIREKTIGFMVLIRRTFEKEKWIENDISILETIISLSAASIENNRLYEQTLKEQITQKELQVAHSIQVGLQAKIKPVLQKFQVAATSVPARIIGGDYYDFFPLTEKLLAVTLTDIVGKGIPAALIMAFFKGVMQFSVYGKGGPDGIFYEINDNLYRNKSVKNYIPSVFAILDDEESTYTYTNAGHENPLLYRSFDGSFRLLEKAGGLPLGAFKGSTYDKEMIFMEPGDIVVMFTDGITEARNKQGLDFGIYRLQDFIHKHKHLDAQGMVNALQEAILIYSEGVSRHDDFTVIIIKRA
jgi:serine phosphatase RsbU (regulator of sigma subunit)